MKKKVLVIAGMLAGLCFSLEAHAPKKNGMTFDREGMKIAVKAFHSVGNPDSHFVKKIVLEQNGAEIAQEEFNRQTNKEYQETEFALPSTVSIQKGDEITVTSYCNKFGKKKPSSGLTNRSGPSIPLPRSFSFIATGIRPGFRGFCGCRKAC